MALLITNRPGSSDLPMTAPNLDALIVHLPLTYQLTVRNNPARVVVTDRVTGVYVATYFDDRDDTRNDIILSEVVMRAASNLKQTLGDAATTVILIGTLWAALVFTGVL